MALVSTTSAPRSGFLLDTPGRQPCVFLDRDGVINTTDGFVNSPEDLDRQLIPSSVEALARLSRETTAKIVVVTNQGGVSAGKMTEEQAEAILERLSQRVEEAGGRLDAIYYCPNARRFEPPAGEVDARKPEPGMVYRAALDFGPEVDLADSYFIGDMTTDIAAGERADARLVSVLVETGFGGRDGKVDVQPDHTCRDLSEAVDWIISRELAFGELGPAAGAAC